MVPITAPGYNGTLTVYGVSSAITTGLTVEVTTGTILPSGFPALQSSSRNVRSQDLTVATALAPLLYVELEPSGTFTGTSAASDLTVEETTPGDAYYIAFFDPLAISSGWQLGWAGPAAPSGTALHFTHAQPLMFDDRTVYLFAFYAVSAAATTPTPATPTPTPTSAATSTPTPTATSTATPISTSTPTPTPAPGALVVAPTSVSISSPGATATIVVSENGYAGTFVQTDSCGGGSPIASFSAASASGPTWTLTVTGVSAGTCTATFSDANNQQVVASITVTGSGFTIQSARRPAGSRR